MMNSIRPFRSLLTNGVITLLIFILSIEALSWVTAHEAKSIVLNRAGGLLPYAGLLIRTLLLPEIITVLVLTWLMNSVRLWFKIELVDTTWLSLARYELSFLPVMMLAFVIFNPFTESVRYLLTEFPTYSFTDYWTNYIITTYSWAIYFRYTFPIMLIGYSALNISLITNALKSNRPLAT